MFFENALFSRLVFPNIVPSILIFGASVCSWSLANDNEWGGVSLGKSLGLVRNIFPAPSAFPADLFDGGVGGKLGGGDGVSQGGDG